MQKKSIVAVLLGAAFVMPLAAHAEGLYVTAGLGQSLYNDVTLDGVVPLNDAKPGTGSIAVGYKLDDTWDAEVGYIHFGNAKYSGTFATTSLSYKIRTQALYAAAVGKVPFTSSLSGHGKLGLAVNHSNSDYSEVNSGVSTFNSSRSDTKSSVLLGVGLAYQFTPALAGLLDYTYIGKVSDADVKVSIVSLGLRYHF